jgi:PIN domain nuclease of toxin-antitoxin system
MSAADAVGAVLLDTCAVIWLANGDPLAPEALAAIVAAGLGDGVYVSPVSAWEIGILSRPRVGREPGPRFQPDAKSWFSRVMAGPGIRQAALTPEIAIDASYLPGELHGDPGDRLLISTARHLGMPIVTRDRRIIEYAEAGWVRMIAC